MNEYGNRLISCLSYVDAKAVIDWLAVRGESAFVPGPWDPFRFAAWNRSWSLSFSEDFRWWNGAENEDLGRNDFYHGLPELAFGFKPLLVVPGEGDAIIHSQLVSPDGNGMIMVSTDRGDPDDARPPSVLGGNSQAFYVVIENVRAHYERSKSAGATIVREPVAQGERGLIYTCRDPEGYLWNFGEYDPWSGPH